VPSKSPPTEETLAAFDAIPLGDLVRRRVETILTRLSGSKVEGLYPVLMREVERSIVATVLVKTDGRREEAAKLLGMHRNTLRLRITALGLENFGKAGKS
jgi:Fis family transcriptional regulator